MTAPKKSKESDANSTLENLDPGTLIIAANVRTETKISPEFVANIKLNGVIVPILGERDATGAVEVTDGQRRTLAAVQAGLKLVPVFIVSAADSAAARLLTQITVNDQREGLDEAEHVAAYKQLSLFGIPAATIAKSTGANKARVQKSLDVAANEVAANAFSKYALTLDQAAQLVDFGDDAEVVKALTKVAETDPSKFDHAVNGFLTKKAMAEERDRIDAQLVSEGAVVLTRVEGDYVGHGDGPEFERLERMARTESPTVCLLAADLAGHPGLAGRSSLTYGARPDGSYGSWPTIQYLLLKEYAGEFVPLTYDRKLTPEQEEARAEREIEIQAQNVKRAALAAADKVRSVWIAEFFQRSKLPDVTAFLALGMTFSGYGGVSEEVLTWLEIPGDEETKDRGDIGRAYLAANPRKSERFMVAVIVADNEQNLAHTWNIDPLQAAGYMAQLKEWGYGLSEIEQAFITNADAA
ncbi:ParB/RepB/Spo0J family partition protein [Cryobacterium psychrophilum]|uniref:ParB-like N-terminal domain-containing protein n=1 Tax=Cryobacterium psychrophilum TaxID=41988 RepID=A0A4Y8KPZ9_9MICO|nr:ParB N-terminal domain-containing protein [Cryobacterium psychrophilum]TDW30992.1 ParB/RepB/Spo0J family partition protein [Cryobacterium psychrophilum]TFD80854.1 hypothetical protein E3T53_04315 [Cryobacterium psychrophilum]